jgi:hypothetical protein
MLLLFVSLFVIFIAISALLILGRKLREYQFGEWNEEV